LIGDMHIGLKTQSFNLNVAKKRMLRTYDRALKFHDIHKKFTTVKHLHVFLLGDIPEGELIGKQVMLDELQLPLREQKFESVEMLANMLVNLCQYYEAIDVVCVAGNHGIMGKMFSFASNWNIEIYDLLACQMRNYEQVKFHVEADTFYKVHKVRRTKFLVLHGDKIPMHLSIPFYGLDRRTLRWNVSIGEFDYAVVGHFHSLNYICPSGIPILMNGTLSTGSRYCLQWLGVEEQPSFWTFFVGDKYGITAWHRIDHARED